MNEIDTVYVASSGDYEDYRIEGIFTTRKAAQEYMDTAFANWNEIEEFALDWPDAVARVRAGEQLWYVLMLRDGTVEEARTEEVSAYNVREVDMGAEVMYRSRYHPPPVQQDVLACTVWAKSQQHAVEIVNERRIKIIAEGKWSV